MASAKALIPVRSTHLDGLSPIEVAAQLRHLPGLVFFDSSGNLPGSAHQPVSVISAHPQRIWSGSIHQATDRQWLRNALDSMPKVAGDHGFPLGGLCGWVSYEGNFVFGEFHNMLVFDHTDEVWWETGNLSHQLSITEDVPALITSFQSKTSYREFHTAVHRIKEWISAGDVYQANLSQAFEAQIAGGSLFRLYEALRDASPAPMAAWLDLDGKEVLSSSPESFLKISGRHIETQPIKGTRPRFSDPGADRRSAYELQTSPKEIAELVMITDLLRNDLGQVCEYGSVKVSEMLRLETLEQVHHLVSTVAGTLREDCDAIDALAACFPGGSITGAPKKRAMEIIQELEPQKRGIYCGAIGWFGTNGESSFNSFGSDSDNNFRYFIYMERHEC